MRPQSRAEASCCGQQPQHVVVGIQVGRDQGVAGREQVRRRHLMLLVEVVQVAREAPDRGEPLPVGDRQHLRRERREREGQLARDMPLVVLGQVGDEPGKQPISFLHGEAQRSAQCDVVRQLVAQVGRRDSGERPTGCGHDAPPGQTRARSARAAAGTST